MSAAVNTLALDFAALIDDAPTPWFILDEDSPTIRWSNQAGQEWLGQSLRTLESKPLGGFIKNFSAVEKAYRRCAESRSVVRLRHVYLDLDQRKDQKCHLTFFQSESGIGLAVQFAGLRSSDARAGGQAISAMGRMFAHEVKNPLAGIKGAAQLLLDDVATDEGQSLIGLIGSEIDRISRMIDGIETLGERVPDRETTVNVHQILQSARTIIQSAAPANINFTEQYDPSLPDIVGDADTLMQAVLNLIKNAVEAIQTTGNGGEITLETSFRSGARRRLGSGDHSSKLPIEIRIIDNGPGISNNVRDQIFQPFVTNKPSGQGLGLSVVSKVASAHNGLVEIHSRPGRTVFSILLPLHREAMP